MRDEFCALIFEYFSAQYVIPMIMRIDHILHGLISAIGNLFSECFGSIVMHRVGNDNAVIGDDKHASSAAVGKGIYAADHLGDGVGGRPVRAGSRRQGIGFLCQPWLDPGAQSQ